MADVEVADVEVADVEVEDVEEEEVIAEEAHIIYCDELKREHLIKQDLGSNPNHHVFFIIP